MALTQKEIDALTPEERAFYDQASQEVVESEVITYEPVPTGTFMRVYKKIRTTNGVPETLVEIKDVLLDKTKEDIKADLEAEATEKETRTAEEVAELRAIKSNIQ